MSCSTTPGNRCALLLAQHSVPPADAQAVVTLRTAQHAFHTLHREGVALNLPAPDQTEVARWFDEQHFRAALDVESARSRNAITRNLDAAHQEWKLNRYSLSGPVFHAWRHTRDLAAYTATREQSSDVTIAYDCDGVLYDFNDTLREWLAARGWDKDRMPEPHTYSLRDAWGLHDDTLHREMPLAVDAGVLWHRGIAHEDGVASARDMGLRGHRILINTARALPGSEGAARTATVTWLRSAGVHFDDIHVADPKRPDDKMRVDFDLLLDDHPENVRAAHRAGRNAYLVDRKWNRDAPELPRVTFDQVPALVETFKARA